MQIKYRTRTYYTDAQKALIWERCKEVWTLVTSFTMANDINVYFCDRQSPWQRGSKTKAKSLISMIEKSQFEFLGKDTSLSAFL